MRRYMSLAATVCLLIPAITSAQEAAQENELELPDGFDEPIAITLIFSTPRAVRTGDLTVHLDVVATSVGTEIPPAHLYANRELIPEGAP